MHFKEENAPEDAPAHCLDGCVHRDECPYFAPRFYLEDLEEKGGTFAKVVSLQTDKKSLLDALKDGPYGRCVYHCDNNVVDHQAVAMEFEDGSTATFTMAAFTKRTAREIKVMGTAGELYGDMNTNLVTVYPFAGEEVTYNISELAEDFSGHGGGDHRMMSEFFDMLEGRASETLTSIDISVQSHLMSLAAEESRLNGGKGVDIRELAKRYSQK